MNVEDVFLTSSVIQCVWPPGQRCYEFRPAHAHQILNARGVEQPTPRGARYTLYKRETWTEPKLFFNSNADAMAQAGRNLEDQWMNAGDFIRFLSDTAGVRHALFENIGLRNIYDANRCCTATARMRTTSTRKRTESDHAQACRGSSNSTGEFQAGVPCTEGLNNGGIRLGHFSTDFTGSRD